jgi:hypothetical protein
MIAFCSEPEKMLSGHSTLFTMMVQDLKRLSTDLHDRPGSAENRNPGVSLGESGLDDWKGSSPAILYS